MLVPLRNATGETVGEIELFIADPYGDPFAGADVWIEVYGCDPESTGYSYTTRYAPTFIPCRIASYQSATVRNGAEQEGDLHFDR